MVGGTVVGGTVVVGGSVEGVLFPSAYSKIGDVSRNNNN